MPPDLRGDRTRRPEPLWADPVREAGFTKSGFEAAMFQFARFQPLAYGLVAVAVALMAGWIAGMVFRKG